MATESAEGISDHMRGLTVTTIAAVAGIGAGLASDIVTAGAPKDPMAVGVVVLAILIQFPVLHVMGIEFDGLGKKDIVYVAFMTFALWFVSWGILLTTGQA